MAKFFPNNTGGGGGTDGAGPRAAFNLTNDAVWRETPVPGESVFEDNLGQSLFRIKKDSVYAVGYGLLRRVGTVDGVSDDSDLQYIYRAPVGRIALYRLPNGALFVFGGYDTRPASIQDGPNGNWDYSNPPRHTNVADPSEAVSEFAHGQLPDGRIIIAGGDVSAPAEAWQPGMPTAADDVFLYDPADGLWYVKASLPTRRFVTAGVVTLAGRFIVFGGREYTDDGAGNWTSHPSARVDSYDPGADAWTRLADMPVASDGLNQAVLLDDGRIFVYGGRGYLDAQEHPVYPGAYIYDPTADTWTTCALDSTTETYAVTAFRLLVVGTKVYVAGGTLDGDGGDTGIDYIENSAFVRCYDVSTDSWSGLPDMVNGRKNGALAMLGGSIAYIGGDGDDQPTTMGTIEVYDPKMSKWVVTASPRPFARGGWLAETDGVVLQGGDDYWDNTAVIPV